MNSQACISILDGSVTVSHDFILENAYAGDDDVVIAASSLVEGIGNKYSDLDIYVIKKALPKASEIDLERHHRVITADREIVSSDNLDQVSEQDVLVIHTVIPGTNIKVDVEFKTFAYFDRLAARVDELFNYAANNLEMLSKVLTDRDNSIFHRLLNAVVIKNEADYQQLNKKFNPDQYCYLAYRWLASDFSVLLDIFGAASRQEWDRCIEISRINILHEMQAYIHLLGCTNIDPKWMLTYLDKLQGKQHGNIRENFYRLFYLQGVAYDSGRSKQDYMLECLDFCDELFHLSRTQLLRNPCYPSGKEAIAKLQSRFKLSDVFTYEVMEYQYRAKVYESSYTPTREWLNYHVDGEFTC
ncbi:MAG: hypothetical protein ABW072_14870 [Sedimenticola sp.]